MILPVDPDPLIVETGQGERSFTIEIADDPGERERGLMFREHMDDDHGMLFVFEDQREVGFWMKNTPMPLDLLFIAQDGTIKAIKQGEPFSEAVISPGVPVRFVLELKAGIAAKNDIVDGDKARHRAINQAPGAAQPVAGIAAGAMQFFRHEGFDLAYIDQRPASGTGEPILLIHGFASNHFTNWVAPGWVKTLTDAGYRAIAFDNRGHGASSKSYDPADYHPDRMAGDAAALLGHLGIGQAHVFGYSMGARITAFLALAEPQLVATLIFGGLGIGMVDGVGDWDPIAEALLADDPADDHQSARPRLPHVRRPDQERPQGACRLHRDVARTALRRRGVAHHAADADRRRHQGRHRRIGRGAGRADAERRRLRDRRPRPYAGRRRPHLQEARAGVSRGASTVNARNAAPEP